MTYRKLFLTRAVSTLLVASTLTAQGNCVGGACFVNLDNLQQPIKNKFQKKRGAMVVLKKPRFVSSKNKFKHDSSIDEKIKNNPFDVILDGKITVIFPSYVMTDEEKIAYYNKHKKQINEQEDIELQRIIQPVENIEDRILDRNLPTSDYFCGNDKKAVRIKNSNFYECV